MSVTVTSPESRTISINEISSSITLNNRLTPPEVSVNVIIFLLSTTDFDKILLRSNFKIYDCLRH